MDCLINEDFLERVYEILGTSDFGDADPKNVCEAIIEAYMRRCFEAYVDFKKLGVS